jgi:DsbC/DsbD-like thiol-disulfide interchange protein
MTHRNGGPVRSAIVSDTTKTAEQTMMSPWKILALVSLVWCVAVTEARAADGPVKASLMADVSAIHSTRPFTIGLLLEIDPGWHIYWTNPGDSGLATRVKFKLPDGFTVTPNPFPVPRRFQQAANEVAYGYENAVLITALVTPPENLHIGDEIAIEASASWLVCKQQCVPGKATATLSLKVADHANPANVTAFEKYASVVTPASEHCPDLAEVKATLDPRTHIATILVHWKNPATGIELFPGADEAATVSGISVKKTEKDITPIELKIEPVAGQTPASDRLTVLIGYHDKDGHSRGFETSVPLK